MKKKQKLGENNENITKHLRILFAFFQLFCRQVLIKMFLENYILKKCSFFSFIKVKETKALRNWKISVNELSKRLLVITIITKRLIAVIIVILTIILTIILAIFNRYFRCITKITSIWPVIVSLAVSETIIAVIFAIKISKNNRD